MQVSLSNKSFGFRKKRLKKFGFGLHLLHF